jgi:AcrR family transcriptional regulator
LSRKQRETRQSKTGEQTELIVVQVKKQAIEDAIIAAAFELFSESGFRKTKLSDIAAMAGVGVGNIYSYFPSKTHLLYQVFRPWFLARLAETEALALRESTPLLRIQSILMSLWHGIPETNPGLANSLMEALATEAPGTGKMDPLLRDAEARISAMLADALPADRQTLVADDVLSNLCLMAYDGFAINRRIGDLKDIEATAALVAGLLLGESPARSQKSPIGPAKSR